MTLDFSFSEDQLAFAETIRGAAERDLRPMADKAEETELCPMEVFPWAASLGILGLNFPPEYGGGGGDKVTSAMVVEALAYVNSGLAGTIMSQSGVATEALYQHGTEEQRQQYLPRTFAGELVAAISLTEPEAGSDLSSVATTATPDGDGYLLRGAKVFASNATIADYICVLARIAGSSGREGMTLFVLDTDNEGFIKGPHIKKLGHRSADTGQFTLDNAWVPASAIIGEIGLGLDYAKECLASGRIDFAARCIGVSRAAYDYARQYAQERKQFSKSINKFQVNKFKFARMATQLEAASTMTYKAASLYDQKSPDAVQIASMAKLFTSEVAQMVTWESLQIHGAYGYTREYPIEQLFRDARLFTISEGTSEIQHIIIAKTLELDSQ